MFKFRISIGMVVFMSSVCLVWPEPKRLTDKQKQQRQQCDDTLGKCVSDCPPDASGGRPIDDPCQNSCANAWAECYQKAGISTPPRRPRIPTQTITTTATPAPKRVVPHGNLTQAASPTATPKTGVRQPHGTLTQASPTPTPTAQNKKKKN